MLLGLLPGMFKDKTLMITGGTGTFGSAALRRFIDTEISEIRIFSRDEKKQDDMRHHFKDDRLKFIIGDVREERSIKDAMVGVNYVFHAAALKQVPSCEFYPMQAVRTNVMGSDNMLHAATECGVERVIVLSTDKAAYPINAMGMSKALMEKMMVAHSRNAEKFGCIMCATRYGNVMASRGSVIPLFLNQLKSGGAMTVTDPTMTRFMMTIEDAIDLVLFAFTHAQPGDLFVQKAPAATIEVLTEAINKLFKTRIPVKVIGTRHGEKLYETLLTREEKAKAEDMGNYFRVPSDGRDLNYGKFYEEGQPFSESIEDYNSHNTTRLDVDGMIELLLKLEVVHESMKELGVK